jgi:hypothetical protein
VVPHGTVLPLTAIYIGRTGEDGTKQINMFNFRHQFCIGMGLVMPGICLQSVVLQHLLSFQPDAKSRVRVLVGDSYCT